MAQGLRRGYLLYPLLFKVFSRLYSTSLEHFSEDADILADIVHLQEQPLKVGPETALEC